MPSTEASAIRFPVPTKEDLDTLESLIDSVKSMYSVGEQLKPENCAVFESVDTLARSLISTTTGEDLTPKQNEQNQTPTLLARLTSLLKSLSEKFSIARATMSYTKRKILYEAARNTRDATLHSLNALRSSPLWEADNGGSVDEEAGREFLALCDALISNNDEWERALERCESSIPRK